MVFCIRKWIKRFLCLTCSIVILFSSASFASANIEFAEERDQTVRVLLTRLNLTDRLDITTNTSYLLVTEKGLQVHFGKDAQMSFILKDEQIYLYYQGMSLQVGKALQLKRTETTETPKGFQVTNFPTEYFGDLRLDIVDNKLRAVLSIHVEDYLLGVVPYEMGNDFPLEALKAQAVAARTYALKSQNQRDEFDVYDNTNDQVFRGYVSGNELAEQAIAETVGVCGFYKGKLAQCFYSASNGGQTELVQSVWPSREDLSYYAFGEDPYDLENPASTVRSFELLKYYDRNVVPETLRKLVFENVAETLKERGHDDSSEGIRIDGVKSVVIDTPNTKNSKLMTMLHLEVSISVRKQAPKVVIIDQDAEEVSLFAADEATATPSFTETPEPQEEQQIEVEFGPFEHWSESVLLDLPIFPDAEKAFGLSINSNFENEIWTVVENDDRFVIEARRFGHGVGMSQRGAQVMADKYDKTYLDILGFYYPGMALKRYPEQPRKVEIPFEALLDDVGPAPSPTPRPTLMPATAKAEKGQWYATVTEISDDSSLNLRCEPSLNCEILMRLYKGQRLLILDKCAEDGWVKVATDVIEGYVMERYLTKE